MNLLMSLPDGNVLILTIIPAIILLIFPALAISYYLQNKKLKKQVKQLSQELDELKNSLIA